MTLLAIRGLTKNFGPVEILKGVDLEVNKGEVVSIIGASGSGKTTLLRCVNLLEDFNGGEIVLDGVAIGYTGTGDAAGALGERELARQRAMTGMVFQSFNLFPHLTALGNVMLGLTKVRRHGQARGPAACHELAGPRRPCRSRRASAQPAFGRAAAARCHCPRPGDGSQARAA